MNKVKVNLSAGKEAVGQPWIWLLSRDFNVQVNIVRANVDADYGYIQIELTGSIEDIQRSTAWLMTTGMHVENLDRAIEA